jgi:hypothetical protein
VTEFPVDPLIEQLRSNLLERTRGMPEKLFKVRGLWRLDYRYRPNELERDLAYSIVLVQAQHQGAAYVTYQSALIDDAFLGADTRYIASEEALITIAALDAAYANLPRSPARTITYSGDAETKAVRRSEIICEEIAQIAAEMGVRRVLNIGVMGNFVPWIRKAGLEYLGADYDEMLIQNGIGGHVVLDGRGTLQAIKNADIVLCTGMTLTTGTLSGIIEQCKMNRAKLVLFAATGSYFGETYCDRFGVDRVISEPQPQYMFSGTSVIEVHHHDH